MARSVKAKRFCGETAYIVVPSTPAAALCSTRSTTQADSAGGFKHARTDSDRHRFRPSQEPPNRGKADPTPPAFVDGGSRVPIREVTFHDNDAPPGQCRDRQWQTPMPCPFLPFRA
ncbi:hypothetical protein MRX96_029112 [Rhipicephalus microplus]